MTFFFSILKGHFTCFKTIVNRFQPTGLSIYYIFYANREPFGKMLTLIDFAFEKKKRKLLLLLEKHLSNNDYD